MCGTRDVDSAVREYCPFTYKKLYAVRVSGKEYLLPSASVLDFQENLDERGSPQEGTIGVGFYLYARPGPDHPTWPHPYRK